MGLMVPMGLGSHGVGLDPMGFAVADGSHWVAGLWLGSLITPRAP